MSFLPSRNRGIRLPDDDDDDQSHHDRNAFDLTIWDMISQSTCSTCGTCLPFFKRNNEPGPQLDYYDEEDDYEFQGLLAAQDQDQLTSFLSGNPFKRGRRGRPSRRRVRINQDDDEGFEGDEEEGHGSAIYQVEAEENDAQSLGNDQIDRFTELVGREAFEPPNEDVLEAEERAAAEEEEAEIARKRRVAQRLAMQKGFIQTNDEEHYPELDGDNQMVDFVPSKHDENHSVPYPTAHIAPVAKAIPYTISNTFELEEQNVEDKMQVVVEHTVVENANGEGAQDSVVVVAEPSSMATPAANMELEAEQPEPSKRQGRTNSMLFTAQLEDLTKKLSFIKNNVLASLDDVDDVKSEPSKEDADEISLNEEELEEFTTRAEQTRKGSRSRSEPRGTIGLNTGGALFTSSIGDDNAFSFFTNASSSSGSNNSESNRNSEDDENADNIIPAPVAKIANAAWTYANKTIQNVNVDEAAQKAAASLQGWIGKAASAAQKAANQVAEEAKSAWAFVGEEGEFRRKSRDDGLQPDRRRELDGRMRSLRANSLQPQAAAAVPQPSISAPSRGGFV